MLYDSATSHSTHRHASSSFSDYRLNFPCTFAMVLAAVKKQEAWKLIKLEIKNNLMDENLRVSWIPDSVNTFCQELHYIVYSAQLQYQYQQQSQQLCQ